MTPWMAVAFHFFNALSWHNSSAFSFQNFLLIFSNPWASPISLLEKSFTFLSAACWYKGSSVDGPFIHLANGDCCLLLSKVQIKTESSHNIANVIDCTVCNSNIAVINSSVLALVAAGCWSKYYQLQKPVQLCCELFFSIFYSDWKIEKNWNVVNKPRTESMPDPDGPAGETPRSKLFWPAEEILRT